MFFCLFVCLLVCFSGSKTTFYIINLFPFAWSFIPISIQTWYSPLPESLHSYCPSFCSFFTENFFKEWHILFLAFPFKVLIRLISNPAASQTGIDKITAICSRWWHHSLICWGQKLWHHFKILFLSHLTSKLSANVWSNFMLSKKTGNWAWPLQTRIYKVGLSSVTGILYPATVNLWPNNMLAFLLASLFYILTFMSVATQELE